MVQKGFKFFSHFMSNWILAGISRTFNSLNCFLFFFLDFWFFIKRLNFTLGLSGDIFIHFWKKFILEFLKIRNRFGCNVGLFLGFLDMGLCFFLNFDRCFGTHHHIEHTLLSSNFFEFIFFLAVVIHKTNLTVPGKRGSLEFLRLFFMNFLFYCLIDSFVVNVFGHFICFEIE